MVKSENFESWVSKIDQPHPSFGKGNPEPPLTALARAWG